MSNTLCECTYKNTPEFSFNNMEFEARCVKVYDGDSITAVFKFNGQFYRFGIRMAGYDSPELRSKETDLSLKKQEEEYARISKQILSTLLLYKTFTLRCGKNDKYGRILGVAIIDGVNVNEYMLTHGYCRLYSGGKKEPWSFFKLETSTQN
jgi:endonuclease YncB( thermonuclease family)